jgi:alpha-L-rhamnosidase
MNQFLLGFCVLFAACSMKPIVGTHQPASLRCEYQVDPLAVDTASPRLSWTIESEDRGVIQTAYRVLVASSPELLIRNTGDLWDSGQVPSSQSAHIEYDGSPLISNTTYYWKVRVWDQKGEVSPWSSVANWSMAFLSPEEWQARWICAPGQKPRMSIDECHVYLEDSGRRQPEKASSR